MYLTMLTSQNVHLYGKFVPPAYRDDPRLLGVVCQDEDNDDYILGSAVVELSENSLILRHIYVVPTERRKGAASLMMQGIRDMCDAAEIKLLETWFWDEVDRDEVLEALEWFLLDNGFINVVEYPIYSCKLSDLLNSPYLAKAKPLKGFSDYDCISFDRITANQERAVKNMIKKRGYPDYVPFCRRDMSFISMRDGEIAGCILSSDDEEARVLNIVLLRNFTKDNVCAVKLLATLKRVVSDTLPMDYSISFVWAGVDITDLMAKVLHGDDKYNLLGHTVHGICELE